MFISFCMGHHRNPNINERDLRLKAINMCISSEIRGMSPFSPQGPRDPTEVLLIQLPPGKNLLRWFPPTFLVFKTLFSLGCCFLLSWTKGWKSELQWSTLSNQVRKSKLFSSLHTHAIAQPANYFHSPPPCSPTSAPSSSPSPILAPISRPAIDPGAAPCACGCTFIVHAGHRGAKHNHVSETTHFSPILTFIETQGVAREIKVVSGECESLPILWTIKVLSP